MLIAYIPGYGHPAKENDLSDAPNWASDVFGDDGLVVFAGNFYLVADFYRFVGPGS